MRERKVFGERTKTKKTDEVLKKYFLVFEGSETEVIYFDAVNDLRQEIGINPIIELHPLIRSYSEEGVSNPKRILDKLLQDLEESESDIITYETLCNRIMDYYYILMKYLNLILKNYLIIKRLRVNENIRNTCCVRFFLGIQNRPIMPMS